MLGDKISLLIKSKIGLNIGYTNNEPPLIIVLNTIIKLYDLPVLVIKSCLRFDYI